jgi:energy-coupling factor transporter ATP-binding protein EcfA2
MLTRVRVRNFKKIDYADIELGRNVVFIGPNNSGKTTALQCLALWEIGLKKWLEKRGSSAAEERTGVAINRNDLIAIPIPTANLLWRDLHVRDVKKANGKRKTKNIRIDVVVDGITDGVSWECGLEFDYANEESLYVRPLRLDDSPDPRRMQIPDQASTVRIAFLPPMSGLASVEPKWEPGRVNVLLGEGQTAQVLRNLCHTIFETRNENSNWNELVHQTHRLFGIQLESPRYIVERGEIRMGYNESNGVFLDLSSSGRGLQQTLLLLAYLYSNPNTVILLDEPDAHLEVLRQRQTYNLVTDIAEKQNSQIVAASHSEIVLNEAAGKDLVVAFVGEPHVIKSSQSQVLKSLTSIGFEQYYQAEVKGWVLYLEGSTDLAILKALAAKVGHSASRILDDPFVYYVNTNLPATARNHFFGLKEAKPDLVGVAIFDRLDSGLNQNDLVELMWKKREIENYICFEEALLAYAQHAVEDAMPDDLFRQAESKYRIETMRTCITEISSALHTLKNEDPWSPDIKASEDFLEPLFKLYFQRLSLFNMMAKSDFHELARFVPQHLVDLEVVDKLNRIVEVARKARPREH